MFNLVQRSPARMTIVALLAMISLVALVGSVWALELGVHPPREIQAACTAANGDYREDGEGYTCTTAKGSVSCTYRTEQCSGVCSNCPKTKGRPVNSVGGVLRGSSGAASSAAGGTATKRRIPVNDVGRLKVSGGTTGGGTHPVVLQRSSGHSSGGSKH